MRRGSIHQRANQMEDGGPPEPQPPMDGGKQLIEVETGSVGSMSSKSGAEVVPVGTTQSTATELASVARKSDQTQQLSGPEPDFK